MLLCLLLIQTLSQSIYGSDKREDSYFDCSKPDDYEDRLSDLRSRNSCYKCPEIDRDTSRDDKPIRWLHIPKTGTSFSASIVQLGCPTIPGWAEIRTKSMTVSDAKEEFGADYKNMQMSRSINVPYFATCFPNIIPAECNIDGILTGHRPLSKYTMSHMDEARVFSIFRDPVDRIISGFHYDQHDCPSCKNNYTVLQYASEHTKHPLSHGPAGCMTKMLVGRDCGSEYPSKREVQVALKVLNQFYFVGITSLWNPSVCLAHYLTATNTDYRKYLYPAEFMNAKPGSAEEETVVKEKNTLPTLLKKLKATDWADETIYNEAVRIFYERFNSYNRTCNVGSVNI